MNSPTAAHSTPVEALNLPGNWPDFPQAAQEVAALVARGLTVDPQHDRATRLYARISNDPTESRVGVARQVAMMGKRLIREGTPAAGLWIDNDTSAYDEGKAHLREAWIKLKQDLIDGKFRRLRVHRVDRIFRQPRELEDFIQAIGEGSRIIIHDNERAYRQWRNQEQIELRNRVLTANSESAILGQRVRDAKSEARHDGNPPNWHMVYGFDGGRQGDKVINVSEMKLIVEVFDRLDAGSTMTDIAHDFNKRKAPTKFATSRGWSQAQISRIARNSRYAGWVQVSGEYIDDDGNAESYSFAADIEAPSHIPDGFQWPIIDPEKFERVQNRINAAPWKGRDRADNIVYPFSRGPLVCGICGGRMAGGRHSKYKYEIYSCTTGRFHGSRGGRHWLQINAAYVEDVAYPPVRQWLSNPWNAGQALYGDQAARGTHAYKAAQEDERRLRNRLDKLELRYTRGTVSGSEYDRRFEELDTELANVLGRLRELEGTGSIAYQATWAEVEERWADLVQRRALIRAATERIEVLSSAEANGRDRVRVVLKPDVQPEGVEG